MGLNKFWIKPMVVCMICKLLLPPSHVLNSFLRNFMYKCVAPPIRNEWDLNWDDSIFKNCKAFLNIDENCSGSRLFGGPFSLTDSTDSGGECMVLACSSAGSTRLSSVASTAFTVSRGVICRLLWWRTSRCGKERSEEGVTGDGSRCSGGKVDGLSQVFMWCTASVMAAFWGGHIVAVLMDEWETSGKRFKVGTSNATLFILQKKVFLIKFRKNPYFNCILCFKIFLN